MKTAKEWLDYFNYGRDATTTQVVVDVEDITTIQADALRHAAAEARKLNDGHDWPISRLLEAEAARIEKESR